ncbi:kelch-like protein 5 [Phlebotomus argentipes]|uniref:kelch-like protein 5 n=1 Tax=Phlebotomus argentipes TaxID=94469 RepID=UPI0028937EAA|nr:kelch-like protein 5 [Phlebotomus argentipes]
MEGPNSNDQRNDQGSSQDHVVRSSKKMWLFQENKTLCDVMLIAGEDKQIIPAHRVVLSAATDYFEAMFAGNFRESQEQEVTLSGISGDDLRRLVKYCYTGEIELSEESSVESVKTLMSSGNHLQLDGVVKVCCALLERHLNPSNCLGLADFADQLSCESLEKAARKYISQHFLQVYKNGEFLQLSVEQLGKLLAKDDLNVSSSQREEDVFRALLVWFQHDSEKRKDYIRYLLPLIQLHRLSSKLFVDEVKPLCESTNCQDLAWKAVEWKLIPERCAPMSNQKIRRSIKGKLMAVIYNSSRDCHHLKSYCPETKQWIPETEIRVNRIGCGIVLENNNIIVIGGNAGGIAGLSKEVNSFHIKSKTIQSLSPMNSKRTQCCAAVLDGFLQSLYVFGGKGSGTDNQTTVERLDLRNGIWNMETPMQTGRSDAAAVAFQERLFVIGGRSDGVCLNSVECYNPYRKEWSYSAPMVELRHSMGVTATRDYIYAFGGCYDPYTFYNHLRSVERYDPKANVWSIVATLNIAGPMRTVLLEDKILCARMAPMASNIPLKVVQFDPESNTSSEFGFLNLSGELKDLNSRSLNILLALIYDTNTDALN